MNQAESFQLHLEKEHENPVLGRKELDFIVIHSKSGTPSRFDIRKKVSEMLNTPIDNIYVINIYTKSGQGVSKARVHVYKDAKRGEEIEEEHIRKRNMPPEEKGGENE